MSAHRYIQAVLARDLAEDIQPLAPATIDQLERAADRAVEADQHRERAEQLSFRFVDLDRRFGI
ncbi:hypothetical protein BJ123_12849 [Rhodopseudomonas thermotolerans]|uniref:Uncharacterized protein n=2 Tax=Rhodopseudomonas TaxID=1073 RepID=A0A336K4J0_9BRAD|nr:MULTISPECIES: hypothetical protein [Rhodopseudomonas]RED26097.1 hypothetical protein BJ125_12849 [Rhodopseudomonas pentothenatexigens]REF91058.1 hypothetical protein BJ123_12849 [Rhodopseudomonas thermotolerans]SSW93021.1 hypothetical protein SAMN05892882_12849 [Rhodopseudomonas pentothenatexigens]